MAEIFDFLDDILKVGTGAIQIAGGISSLQSAQQASKPQTTTATKKFAKATPEETFAIRSGLNQLTAAQPFTGPFPDQEALRRQLGRQVSAQFSGQPAIDRAGLIQKIQAKRGQIGPAGTARTGSLNLGSSLTPTLPSPTLGLGGGQPQNVPFPDLFTPNRQVGGTATTTTTAGGAGGGSNLLGNLKTVGTGLALGTSALKGINSLKGLIGGGTEAASLGAGSAPGLQGAPGVSTAVPGFGPTGGTGGTPSLPFDAGKVLSLLGLAGGVAGAITGPNAPSRALSGAAAVASGLKLASSAGFLPAAIGSVAGPLGIVAGIGSLIAGFFGGDKPTRSELAREAIAKAYTDTFRESGLAKPDKNLVVEGLTVKNERDDEIIANLTKEHIQFAPAAAALGAITGGKDNNRAAEIIFASLVQQGANPDKFRQVIGSSLGRNLEEALSNVTQAFIDGQFDRHRRRLHMFWDIFSKQLGASPQEGGESFTISDKQEIAMYKLAVASTIDVFAPGQATPEAVDVIVQNALPLWRKAGGVG